MQTIPTQMPLDVLRGCWARLVKAAKPVAPRPAAKRRRPTPSPEREPLPPAIVDPVALTIMAVNRLGPATFRTVSLGRAVTVTVPDRATGDIFRAALDEMQKARLTDRLIRIEIAGEASA
jgi:hypothetical protein